MSETAERESPDRAAGARTPPLPPRLYAIADEDTLGGERLPAAVAAMASAGVGWVQVRAKRLGGERFYRLLERCLERLDGASTALWVDDRADLAVLHGLAGVHVGQRDLPPGAVRRVVGESAWIGCSTHDDGQLRAADADPEVDVVALGPIFPTRSKKNPDPVVGLDGLRRARGLTRKPLVAIGGIDETSLARVLAAGADSAAVLGAVCRGDVEKSCRRLLAAAGEAR